MSGRDTLAVFGQGVRFGLSATLLGAAMRARVIAIDVVAERRTRTSRYTGFVALRNVTITLDEDVARWARIRAAERETSVSRLVGELLREQMLEDQSYDAAMQEYLARPSRKLRKRAARYPSRAELHGR